MTSPPGDPGLVDWDLAVRLASTVAGDGPAVSGDEAARVVAELRADADRSTGLVREFTGLLAADHTAPVLVVDRPGWIQANADAFATLLSPIIVKLAAEKPPSALATTIGSRVTGAEIGGLLGFLAGKVLGQFDPFDAPHGRLLLVAPNIVHVERELGVDPTDFRLWVCLHEETHRVQFTAVPWMRDHLFDEINGFAETMQPQGMVQDAMRRVLDGLQGLRSAGRDGGAGGSGPGAPGLLDVLGTPEQKEFVERMTGVMSLLEGHADVVMDGVGPSVIPSVSQIRASFDRRRQGIGLLDRLLRRLLGLDAKMAQYRDGARFVRAVVDKAGMAEFNAVWEHAGNLPSKAEIHEPEAWMTRVL